MNNFISILQTAFIVLKLCKIVDWNWFLVLLPTIIVLVLFFLYLLFLLKK